MYVGLIYRWKSFQTHIEVSIFFPRDVREKMMSLKLHQGQCDMLPVAIVIRDKSWSLEVLLAWTYPLTPGGLTDKGPQTTITGSLMPRGLFTD